MKIRLAAETQPPPNEPVLVFLDGSAQAPGVDYTIREGELPDFKFNLGKPPLARSYVLLLVPRLTHQLMEPSGLTRPATHDPVAYQVRWENDELVAYGTKP